MTCECKPTFRGEFCGEKIPEKVCTKWRDTHCTAHPLEWYQPGCSTLWDHQYRYATWAYCTTHLSGYHICKKTYMCQPNTEGHDCCGALGSGERWNER